MKERCEFFPASKVPWPVPGSPGQYQRILTGDGATPDHSRMLRLEPGAVTSQSPAHDFWEEVWILEGMVRDADLDETFTVGIYARRPPRVQHGPRETPHGCTTLELRYPDGKTGGQLRHRDARPRRKG